MKYCSIHGPLPDGLEVCELCPPEVVPSGVRSANFAVPSVGVEGVSARGGFHSPAPSALEYRVGRIEAGRSWTLGLRLACSAPVGAVQVRAQVSGQTRVVRLVPGFKESCEFSALPAGDYVVLVKVTCGGQEFVGAVSISVCSSEPAGPVTLTVEGHGNLVSLGDRNPSQASVDWTECSLRPDRPQHEFEMVEPSAAAIRSTAVTVRTSARQFARLLRGPSLKIGRGASCDINLTNMTGRVGVGQSAQGGLTCVSREALRIDFVGDGDHFMVYVLNQNGIRFDGRAIECGSQESISVRELERGRHVELGTREVSIRLHGIRRSREHPGLDHGHHPWTPAAEHANRLDLGGVRIEVSVLGDRSDVVWVLDAVAARETGLAGERATIFDDGDFLRFIEDSGTGGSTHQGMRPRAVPLGAGEQWERPAGLIRVERGVGRSPE